MFLYSTCRDCGGLLHVTSEDCSVHADCGSVHPGCTPRPTKYEQLLEDYVEAIKADDQPRIDALQEAVLAAESAPPRLAEAAVHYADQLGWPVFPLLAFGEPHPYTGEISDGKKPASRHGLKDATTDVNRIERWWIAHPHHNIGLPTGYLFDVVDIDPRHGGMDSYRAIIAAEDEKGEGLIPDAHGKVTTGNHGWHFYVEPTGAGNRANMMAGIDIRGKGGYVVAPPSQLADHEHRYQWMVKPSPVIRK